MNPVLPESVGLDPVEELRAAPAHQNADGEPLWIPVPLDPSRPVGKGNPPRARRRQGHRPRSSHMEVEVRIAEAQMWVAQRLPLAVMREKASQDWGITNIKTVSRYLAIARERMVEELISDRRRHQAEQIFALNECARRAMEAEQFEIKLIMRDRFALLLNCLTAPAAIFLCVFASQNTDVFRKGGEEILSIDNYMDAIRVLLVIVSVAAWVALSAQLQSIVKERSVFLVKGRLILLLNLILLQK